jgi:DNA-binding beta-propeller fold protein YncE
VNPLRFVVAALAVLTTLPHATSSFTEFETGQVRPLAQSPDGTRLFAINTPDNRLEIFDVGTGTLTHVGSVPVGLEPIAVAARTNGEVWVVNHLSDSISIVDVTVPASAHVVRTLLVGDEPRDIVFAGPGATRAFITTAHRGQNTALQATIATVLLTEGLGRADVWVFDATDLGTSLGGTPSTIINLFGDTPRALAVSPDGSRVYAAIFQSGNRTMTINENFVPDGGSGASGPSDCSAPPGGLPPPNTNFQGIAGPEVGLIVKFNGTHWVDELNRCWDSVVRFSLPDRDVFAIDAMTNPPSAVPGSPGTWTGVGTILFNMATNPITGDVYVSNLDSLNDVRFEGVGAFAAGFKQPGEPASVRGHLAESRISILHAAGASDARHLNKHIDYTTCCAAVPNAENDASLAFPLGMAVSNDGTTLYVAGFGSSAIGVYDTAELAANSFVPGASSQVRVSGGGPTGLVLDETRSQLYVLTRFDDSVSVVSTATGAEPAHVALHNPEPASIVNGRPFLYDARATSSHGDSACASCHIFSDFDSLAWDLGDPNGVVVNNPGPFRVGPFIDPNFHPMKGPMTTQSLRGMANHGPMHWRGDRTGGNEAPNVQPDSGAFDEVAAFKKFNPAFQGLIGRNAQLTAAQMQAFTDFILQVTYPPNPIRNLDNSLTAAQQAGHDMYFGEKSDTVENCNGCHRLVPGGNANFGVSAPGFFGGDGESTFEGETQILKVPHLRNMYQKVGMFGFPFAAGGGAGNTGDQIRGFGFLHDGSVDTLFRFHSGAVFTQSPINPGGFPAGAAGDAMRRNMDAFMMAYDSNMAPIVGQQITRRSTSSAAVDGRIDLMIQRADVGECDLVANAIVGGTPRGFVYLGSGEFATDHSAALPISDTALRALAGTGGQEITYTCTPPGSGVRIGVDQDGDGFADGDERDGGSDPADASSVPSGAPMVCESSDAVTFKHATMNDSRGSLSLTAEVLVGGYTQETVGIVATDGDGPIFNDAVAGAAIIPKGSTFRYRAPSGTTGIRSITLRAKNGSVTRFKVTLRTSHAWSPGLANQDAASTLVTLNVGGQCFRGPATRVR